MNKPKISMIAAVGENRELGKNNGLLWDLPTDMKHFRDKTRGHAVIMGRKTWDSLPPMSKPLPGRVNIIISRIKSSTAGGLENVFFRSSLSEAIKLAKEFEKDEIFIIGGGQIYKQAMDEGIVDKLYLTQVHDSPKADVFFPDYSEYKKIVGKEEPITENGYTYEFVELEK